MIQDDLGQCWDRTFFWAVLAVLVGIWALHHYGSKFSCGNAGLNPSQIAMWENPLD